MKRLVLYLLIAWFPFTLELFALLTPRRAALIAFLLGWMFLPVAPYAVAGTPGLAKLAVTCLAVLVGIAVVDFRRLVALRITWVDVPILLFCLSPLASTIVNHLGLREGMSAVASQIVTWGVPYAVGRLYFDEFSALRDLATGIFIGGLVYVPLCIFESSKGPQFHELLYGFHQMASLRPRVFMDNDLMVALWLAAAAVLGFWLWQSEGRSTPLGISIMALLPLLVITSILQRCVNGWLLMLMGVGLLVASSALRSPAPVLCVTALILAHIVGRGAGIWSGNQVVSAIGMVSGTKADSIAYRFRNEDIIASNARQRPIFGWGREPKVLYDEQTDTYAVCDALWMLIFAEFGIVGVIGLTSSLLFPVFLFIRRFPAAKWKEARLGPVAALAVLLVLYMIDHLANAMINPVYMLAAGGLTGLASYRVPSVEPLQL